MQIKFYKNFERHLCTSYKGGSSNTKAQRANKELFKLQVNHTLQNNPSTMTCLRTSTYIKLTAPKNHRFELLEKFHHSPTAPLTILVSKFHLSQPTNFVSKYEMTETTEKCM